MWSLHDSQFQRLSLWPHRISLGRLGEDQRVCRYQIDRIRLESDRGLHGWRLVEGWLEVRCWLEVKWWWRVWRDVEKLVLMGGGGGRSGVC